MSIWDWFSERLDEYIGSGDEERIQLAELHSDGFDFQEIDPDASYDIFTQGSRLARSLNEPWWEFFYDVWRVIALKSYKNDLTNVKDLAIDCTLKVQKPEFNQHPWRFAAFNNLVGIYIDIDPVGLAPEIQQCLQYLEDSIPPGNLDDYYVFQKNRRFFAIAREDFHEALEISLRTLNLMASRPEENDGWYEVGIHASLCWIYHKLQNWKAVIEHGQITEEMARPIAQQKTILMEGLIWQAVGNRMLGDESQACRFYRQAIRRQKQIQAIPPNEFYDGLALFHQFNGDLDKSLKVRNHQYKNIRGRGKNIQEYRAYYERCKLLFALGKFSEQNRRKLKALASRFKNPQQYLLEIDDL